MSAVDKITSVPTNVTVDKSSCLFIIDGKYYPVHAITFRKSRRANLKKLPPLALGSAANCKPLTPYYIESSVWVGYFIYDDLGNLFYSPTEKLDPKGWHLIHYSKPPKSRPTHFKDFGDSKIACSNDKDNVKLLAELVHSYSVDDWVPSPPEPEIFSDDSLDDSDVESIISHLPDPDVL
jgi:hypothetical protein